MKYISRQSKRVLSTKLKIKLHTDNTITVQSRSSHQPETEAHERYKTSNYTLLVGRLIKKYPL